jgi:hypothetical protein
VTGPHAPDCDCGMHSLGDVIEEITAAAIGELAAERAAHVASRRADIADWRATLAAARRPGLARRHAAKLRHLAQEESA